MSIRDSLNPSDRDAFDEWARFQREHNIKGMAESAIVLSVYPSDGEADSDYMLQIGAAVLLGKPLLVLCAAGQELPPKVRLVADEILEVDFDDVDLGTPKIAHAIAEFTRLHVKGQG